MRDLDVAVVGGGLAGLTAAAFSGRAGLLVGLIERATALGGRAQTRNDGGFLFNLGPHALYRGGAGMATLLELGVRVAGGVAATGGAYAIRRGSKHTLPVGAFSLMTSGLLPLAAKVEAGRILAGLGRLRTAGLDGISETEWLRTEVAHEDVRELLGAFLRVSTYSHDPDRQSAGAALAQLQSALRSGVLYLDGGWQTLVDGLRAVLSSTAATAAIHRRVETVESGDGTAFVLRLADGETLRARSVIVAASPREAASILRPVTPELDSWAAAAVPVRAACLDLALDRLPRPEATFGLGMDEPLYASVHSRAARLAPEGLFVFQLARYMGDAAPADGAAVERQLEDLAETLQPGFGRHVVKRRFLPDLVVSNALVRADQGGLGGRPGPAVPGVPGAFVAGDWVGNRGMLADAVLASARAAAHEAVDYVRSSRRAA